jgi:hypothetical protein
MRIFKGTQTAVFLLAVLALAFCLLYIQIQSTANSYRGNVLELGNAIAISTIAAFIFYVFQVLIPERRRKDIVKHNFEQQWKDFKKDFICQFLWASKGVVEGDLPEKLCDVKAFREFAREGNGDGTEGWYGVLNGLEDHHIRDLVIALDRLKNEVLFLLNNVRIDDPEVFAFFKRLSHVEYELRNTNLHDDSLKTFSHFVWEVFAGWSHAEGEKDYDIVQAMIDRL